MQPFPRSPEDQYLSVYIRNEQEAVRGRSANPRTHRKRGAEGGSEEGVKDGAKDEANVATRAAISKAKEVTQEAFRKANKEAQATIANLLYKDSDEGSVRLLFVTSGLEAFEVKQVQEALEKGLNSSWRCRS